MSWRGYKHYNSYKEYFLSEIAHFNVSSLNNHFVSPQELYLNYRGDFRAVVLLRDPRDLLVSGMHYHRSGRELWCRINEPVEKDFYIVNGVIPDRFIGHQGSYAQFLNSVEDTDALLTELQFRQNHFSAMEQWLSMRDDERYLILNYEDILGNELNIMRRISKHFELNWGKTLSLDFCAHRYNSRRSSQLSTHIRNSRPGQGKTTIPDRVLRSLWDDYPKLKKYYVSD